MNRLINPLLLFFNYFIGKKIQNKKRLKISKFFFLQNAYLGKQ